MPAEIRRLGPGFTMNAAPPPKPLGAWWLYHEQRGSDKAWYISARRAR